MSMLESFTPFGGNLRIDRAMRVFVRWWLAVRSSESIPSVF